MRPFAAAVSATCLAMENIATMPDPATPSKPAPLSHTRFWRWLGLALVILALDQISKRFFDAALTYAERWPILPFFDFTLLYNRGAAFSFLADGEGWQRWFFTGIALVASVLIIRLLRRHPQQTLFCAALSCILAGAVGNAIDRLQHGHVVDFLLFYWRDWYFPAFNIADVSITVGAIFLILDELLRIRRERRRARKASP